MNKKEEREVPVLMARDMRSTWLVQRLQMPFPSDSPIAKVQFVTCNLQERPLLLRLPFLA